MKRCDAIVMGAGVAGSACAILLAQSGWSVVLIEKQEFPRRKVCGECIAASNLALFDALGIGASFDALAGPPLRRVWWCAGDTVIDTALPPLPGARPWGRVLGREQLDTLLRDRALAAGVCVLQPCTARSVERVGMQHRCVAVDADGRSHTLQAPLLIDAHGSWQHGPCDAPRPRAARGADLLAFKANFSGANLAPGVLPVLAFDGGYGGMVQGDRGLLTLACCIRRDRLQRWRAQHPHMAAGAAIQVQLGEEIRAVRDALRRAQRDGAWLAVGPIRPRIQRMPRHDGVLLLGNAAGEAHPILGEGISMALQSAFLLSRRLLAGEPDAAAAYARDWRRAFVRRIRLAALYAHLAMQPQAGRALLALLKMQPRLLAFAARAGGKTRCAIDARRWQESPDRHTNMRRDARGS